MNMSTSPPVGGSARRRVVGAKSGEGAQEAGAPVTEHPDVLRIGQ